MEISGYCDSAFEPVREAFLSNFENHSEVGAAIALHVDGHPVLSLWGGWSDIEAETPWTEDTLTNVWSTTKGVAATIVAMLVSKGLLKYEDRVSKHWPEFAACGKGDVTVAMLLSHQSGLSGFREPVTVSTFYDSRAAAATLAAMEPLWKPGHGYGYHPVTIGFLVDELCLRVTGKNIRTLALELLPPECREDIYIGCPDDQRHRAAKMYAPSDLSSADAGGQDLTDIQILALANPVMDPEAPNTTEWRSAMIPSANGFASARGLSVLYGSLVKAENDGTNGLVTPAVLQKCCTPQVSGVDKTLGLEARWGCGYLVNSLGLFGPTIASFGHTGWGGSFAFADPEKRLGFAYVMNKMGTELINDPRNTALVEAIYHCVR